MVIRSANFNDAADIASVHVRAWQESYKGIINQEYLKEISFTAKLQLREQTLTNQSSENVSLVAVHEEKIIAKKVMKIGNEEYTETAYIF